MMHTNINVLEAEPVLGKFLLFDNAPSTTRCTPFLPGFQGGNITRTNRLHLLFSKPNLRNGRAAPCLDQARLTAILLYPLLVTYSCSS